MRFEDISRLKKEVTSIIGSSIAENPPSFAPSIFRDSYSWETSLSRTKCSDPEYDLPTIMKLGMVFQALIFENLNVLENTIIINDRLKHRETRESYKKTFEKVGKGSQYWAARPKQLSVVSNGSLSHAPPMDPDAILLMNRLRPRPRNG